MKVSVFIEHGVDIELSDLLEKVPTVANVEVCGSQAILTNVDMLELHADIARIVQEAERINRIYNKVGYPWMAREILEGKAVIMEGIMVYKNPRNSPLRKRIETVVGKLTDQQYNEVLEAAAQDIEFNKVSFKKEVTLQELIKIAAQCAVALKRCGI